jgi:hypothetical protein
MISRELLSIELEACQELFEIGGTKLVNGLKVYYRYTYRFNAHSLRYTPITHLLRRHKSPLHNSKDI